MSYLYCNYCGGQDHREERCMMQLEVGSNLANFFPTEQEFRAYEIEVEVKKRRVRLHDMKRKLKQRRYEHEFF